MCQTSRILVALWLLVGSGAALAESPPTATSPGVLLLRNGNLLQGQITQSGDHYDVAQRDGEIRVRVTDVEAACRDLNHCYQVKLSHLTAGQINDHLALAEWCLRYGLVDEARLAIRDAAALDSTHPKVAVLERRLQFAVQKPKAEPPVETSSSDQPSSDELDRTSRGLPPRAVETFTTTIQPLLLNHCSTAGCHGPQSATSFHLLRLPSGRTASRRSTQRNLYAALALIDRDKPDNSPLLTAIAGAHGSSKVPIFSKHQSSHYRQLVDWVFLVASQKTPAAAEAGAAETGERTPSKLPASIDIDARPLEVTQRAGSEESPETGGAKSDEKSNVMPAAASWPTNLPVVTVPTGKKPAKRGATAAEFRPQRRIRSRNLQSPAVGCAAIARSLRGAGDVISGRSGRPSRGGESRDCCRADCPSSIGRW